VGRWWDFDRHPAQDEQAVALGPGRPLEPEVRSRFERALGADLSSVRVHRDTVRDDGDTLGFAMGEHVGFRPGAYRPGTPAGDALLAHELAHVLQQREGGGAASDAHERDATATALAVAGGGAARPRLGSRLALQRCSAERAPRPTYLGPESHRALDEIERITESDELLGTFIVLGTAVTMGTAGVEENAATLATGGPSLDPHGQALLAVPVITYNRVLTVIQLHLVMHENEMNEEERAFWHRMHDRVSLLAQQAGERQRAGSRALQQR
jgi:hypothetical protein